MHLRQICMTDALALSILRFTWDCGTGPDVHGSSKRHRHDLRGLRLGEPQRIRIASLHAHRYWEA